jgi:hypothetical protein
MRKEAGERKVHGWGMKRYEGQISIGRKVGVKCGSIGKKEGTYSRKATV